MKRIILKSIAFSTIAIMVVSTTVVDANETKDKIENSQIAINSNTLHLYTMLGDYEKVKFLLDKGVNPNVQGSTGWTPLISASKHNHLNIVKLLIERGAKLNDRNQEGYTALHKASYSNNTEVVKILLKSGANIDAPDSRFGFTPLLLSINSHILGKSNNIESISLLLEKGANPYIEGNLVGTAFDLIRITRNKELLKLFNEYSKPHKKVKKNGESSPKFLDYPVASMYKGKHTPVVLDTEFKRNFRTRLKNTSQLSVNFAGEYILTTWGCGTGCLSGAVVSKKTGKVFWLPGSVSSWEGEGDRLIFRKNSRLLVMAGVINEDSKYGAHFYELTGNGFKHIKIIEIEK